MKIGDGLVLPTYSHLDSSSTINPIINCMQSSPSKNCSSPHCPKNYNFFLLYHKSRSKIAKIAKMARKSHKRHLSKLLTKMDLNRTKPLKYAKKSINQNKMIKSNSVQPLARIGSILILNLYSTLARHEAIIH